MNFDKVHIVQETATDKQSEEKASLLSDLANGDQLPSNCDSKSNSLVRPDNPASTISESGLTEQLKLAECVAKLQDEINGVSNHLEIQNKLLSTKDWTSDSKSPRTKITSDRDMPKTKFYLKEV